MADLLVIVPSRGRPESVARVVGAWLATNAYEAARLVFTVDGDDPKLGGYWDAGNELPSVGHPLVELVTVDTWKPMVHKLNETAAHAATPPGTYFALGFAGDDHLPRTDGWAHRYLAALREMGTGIVYGNDLLQGERLCTSWAMTSDIVQALGRMVPAPVDHMYCDNSVMDLGRQAGCLRYLPQVVVEHCHPLAGKAEWDVGYARVNRAEQFQRDAAAYQRWADSDRDVDVAAVQAVRGRRGPVRDA